MLAVNHRIASTSLCGTRERIYLMRLRVFVPCLALVAVCCVCQAAAVLVESTPDFAGYTLSHARYDRAAGGLVVDKSAGGGTTGGMARGVVESPEIPCSMPFDRAIASWNAFTPKGSYLTVFMSARVGGVWTKWYKMALWNTDGKLWKRTTFGSQGDAFGRTETEVLALKSKADAIKIRVQLESTDGQTYPTLRFVSIVLNDTAVASEPMDSVKGVWGTDLDVPCLSQLSVPGGWAWCSPTSTAMALGYWAKKLHRSDMVVGVTQAARATFDEDWGGTGNWSFNVAYAGEFAGMRAYVSRFVSVSQVEEWIGKGVPVIVALDYGILTRKTSNSGHLMLIRGFTNDGDPIFNDPWTDLKKHEDVRKVFARADFEAAWLGPKGSWGTVYIIYPEGYKL